MQTVPSILEKTPQELFYQINKLSPYFKRFQIDIADGIFVPNKTVQIEEIIEFFELKNFMNFITLETLQTLSFDFHLMVKNYEAEIKKLEKLLALRSFSEGGKKIIKINYVFIHYSLLPNYQLLTTDYSLPIGLTLNPQDQIDDLTSHYPLNTIPYLQIMSVNPGFQGSPFLPETLTKVERLRQLGYRKEIFLDGAVNEKTIPIILSKKYQPDFICPGSFLTKTKALEENVKYLDKL